ncbi:MAG: DUF1365 domain-containing protein, partial [Thioalkalispiraceae bacterium]
YVCLDLDELDTVFKKRWFWSTSKPAIAWFKRSDYLGENNIPLKEAVYQRVEELTGKRPQGPVRLLTHLRYLGYVFNPVSFYYCYDKTDTYIETIVAEITNTPWGERHSYVLPLTDEMRKKSHMRFELDKEFHISPFMDMDMRYDWRFTQPADLLTVHMNNFDNDKKVFDATLSMKKRPMTAANCARALTVFPLMTTKVIFGIYWEALRLFIKRIPFYNHPEKVINPSQGGAEQAN